MSRAPGPTSRELLDYDSSAFINSHFRGYSLQIHVASIQPARIMDMKRSTNMEFFGADGWLSNGYCVASPFILAATIQYPKEFDE
jgi:hypothetical protein